MRRDRRTIGYAHGWLKKPHRCLFQWLLPTSITCIRTHTASSCSCSGRTKELQRITVGIHTLGSPMAKLASPTASRYHVWQLSKNHVRKQKTPRRDRRELFFCVKSTTDNSCIESKARRNNKNPCISKSLILTQYLQNEASNLFDNTSFRKISVWMSKHEKVGNLCSFFSSLLLETSHSKHYLEVQ